MIAFPALDPIAFSIGPVAIRWYALAYMAGFILGWRTCLYLAKQNPKGPPAEYYDEYLTWAVVGTVLGGRIGYILFYQPDYYFSHPFDMLEVWHGGMSFHGGMLGVITAGLLYTRLKKLNFFEFTDVLAVVTPIGLFFGRVANFVNGELFGRVTDVPWGVVFPRGGPMPRHPSQLYEAVMEGLVLFVILFALSRIKKIRAMHGFLCGAFLTGYGVFRLGVEFFREPDAQLGFLLAGATMGQLLCLPMILFGLYLIIRSHRSQQPKKPHKKTK